MVLKFGKRGVNSGNTLKTPSVRFLRSYRKNAYIVREDVNASGEDVVSDTFGLDDLHAPNVPYSLNKKGRWTFPRKMIDAIRYGEFHCEEYGVQLFEKHNITKKDANCVSAYFSKGPVKEVTISKRNGKKKKSKSGYINVNSLRTFNPSSVSRRKNKRLRRRGLPTDRLSEAPTTCDDPQVTFHFDVVYPSPISSSLTHNPHRVGYNYYKTRKISKHQKIRRRNRDIIEFACSNLNSDTEMSEDESECSDTERIPNRTNDLQTFITRAISNKQFKRDQLNNSLEDFVIVTRYQLEDFTNPLTSDDEPIRIMIQHSGIHPNNLSESYGSSYIECNCYPRKFIIDISAEVQALDVFKEDWKENIKPVHACVVFVHDADNEINTDVDSVYKVYLNTSHVEYLSTARIDTLFNYSESTVDECLTDVLFYIESLPNLVQVQQNEFSSSMVSKQLQLERLSEWRSHSYIPNDEYHFNLNMASCPGHVANIDPTEESSNEGTRVHDNVAREGRDPTIDSEPMCEICFMDICAVRPGTALRTCGHWFCDRCWGDQLTYKVKSGALVMDCPSFACQSTVDRGTLLSLLCLTDVIKHTMACHSTDIDRQEETKWCPNSRCGRVLQVESPDVHLVQCDCGQQVCFKCLGTAHWPAPCQSARAYRDVLKDMGLAIEDNTLIAINGMNCPHCNRFFEKIDGCPQMTCICYKSFCWGCGRDWYSHRHGTKCYEIGYKEAHAGTKTKYIFEATTTLNDVWLNTALKHHMSRDYKREQALKPCIQTNARQIARYMNKMSNNISLDFKGSKLGYSKESHKVPEFLEDLLSIRSEMHFIAENIAVLLSSAGHVPRREYFANLIKKFKYNCDAIEECVTYPVIYSDMLRLIRRLKAVRLSSLNLIRSTAHHVKILKLE